MAINRNKVLIENDADLVKNGLRDDGARWRLLIIVIILTISLPTSLGYAVGNVIDFTASNSFFALLGFVGGLYILTSIIHRFWVVVAETSAFVTTRQLLGSKSTVYVPYGPGGHPAFPDELRADSGNITLDVMTIPFEEKVPTSTALMIVKGNVQFKFSLQHITTVVGIDESTIRDGFVSMINEWLSNKLSTITGEEAKNNVKKFRQELETEFESGAVATTLLDEYGIITTGIQIKGIDFTDKVQEVRDTIEEATRIGENLWRMCGFASYEAFEEARKAGRLTEEQISRARDDFLASSGNIKKEVHRVDITGLDPEFLAKVAPGVAGAGAVATAMGKGKGKNN